MTRTQKRNLANLVLAHGYDNLNEFWSELTNQDERAEDDPNQGSGDMYPSYEEAKPVLFAWHVRMIEIADQVTA